MLDFLTATVVILHVAHSLDSYRYTVPPFTSSASFYNAELQTNITLHISDVPSATLKLYGAHTQHTPMELHSTIDAEWDKIIHMWSAHPSTRPRRQLQAASKNKGKTQAMTTDTLTRSQSMIHTKVYSSCSIAKDWHSAEKHCVAQGGHQASSTSATQNAQVRQLCKQMGPTYACWLGLEQPYAAWSDRSMSLSLSLYPHTHTCMPYVSCRSRCVVHELGVFARRASARPVHRDVSRRTLEAVAVHQVAGVRVLAHCGGHPLHGAPQP